MLTGHVGVPVVELPALYLLGHFVLTRFSVTVVTSFFPDRKWAQTEYVAFSRSRPQ